MAEHISPKKRYRGSTSSNIDSDKVHEILASQIDSESGQLDFGSYKNKKWGGKVDIDTLMRWAKSLLAFIMLSGTGIIGWVSLKAVFESLYAKRANADPNFNKAHLTVEESAEDCKRGMLD